MQRGRSDEIIACIRGIREEAIRELNANLEQRVAERTAELAGPLNDGQSKQLKMVRASGRHLLALINDVLDISKIEAGQLEVNSQLFDLRTSIVKVAGIVIPLAEKKNLPLRLELSPEIRALASDQRRVEQVLLNLLNNAIKFTERGADTLTAEIAPGALSNPEQKTTCPVFRYTRFANRHRQYFLRSTAYHIFAGPTKNVDHFLRQSVLLFLQSVKSNCLLPRIPYKYFVRVTPNAR